MKPCPLCGKNGIQVIDLPKHPVTGQYVDWGLHATLFGFQDQALMYCEPCSHAWMLTPFEDDGTYAAYPPTAGGAAKCLENFAAFIGDAANDVEWVLDIGGNDGTCLGMLNVGCETTRVNIDPCASGPFENRKSGIELVRLAPINEHKVILSSHTIEHLATPVVLVAAAAGAMSTRDKLFLQFPALDPLLKFLRFDQLCHQHQHYFSFRSIQSLLNSCGLYINRWQYDDLHFGTLMLEASRTESLYFSTEEIISARGIQHLYGLYTDYYHALDCACMSLGQHGNWIGYGAGQMVPTLAYDLTFVNDLRLILDDDLGKSGKRFPSMYPEIACRKVASDESVIITSISTKQATRGIYAKLIDAGVRNIIIPVMVT
jgi:hypothetical protein